MLIEDAMTGSALADEVECEFPSCVQRIKPEGDKQVRLYVQSAKFEQGRVWFPKEALISTISRATQGASNRSASISLTRPCKTASCLDSNFAVMSVIIDLAALVA